MEIVSINKDHYLDIAKIYRQGIDTGMATFETSAPSWESWNENKLLHSRLIAFENNQALGWAAISKVSSRCVYEGVAEVSIYVSENHRGKGHSKALIESAKELCIATNACGILLETDKTNEIGNQLYPSCGFEQYTHANFYEWTNHF